MPSSTNQKIVCTSQLSSNSRGFNPFSKSPRFLSRLTANLDRDKPSIFEKYRTNITDTATTVAANVKFDIGSGKSRGKEFKETGRFGPTNWAEQTFKDQTSGDKKERSDPDSLGGIKLNKTGSQKQIANMGDNDGVIDDEIDKQTRRDMVEDDASFSRDSREESQETQ